MTCPVSQCYRGTIGGGGGGALKFSVLLILLNTVVIIAPTSWGGGDLKYFMVPFILKICGFAATAKFLVNIMQYIVPFLQLMP